MDAEVKTPKRRGRPPKVVPASALQPRVTTPRRNGKTSKVTTSFHMESELLSILDATAQELHAEHPMLVSTVSRSTALRFLLYKGHEAYTRERGK